ncbi:MAG: deoxyribonuclease IV [Limnohabitans sp.]|nr:deoxyribonuclease IV [Limnohabitans sp.]
MTVTGKATATAPRKSSPCEKHWIGSHLSTAGALRAAIDEAVAYRFGAVQIFTRNQRQWTPKALAKDEVAEFRAACAGTIFEDARRIVSHNSYLVNLASPDAENLKKSIACERAELERCEVLGVPVSVAHPGAHLCASGGKARKPADPNDLDAEPTADELDGLKRIAKSIDAIHRDLRGYRVRIALETTTGSGTNLGYAFHHLKTIRDLVAEPERIAYCIDTCHVFAAGYDVSTPARAKATLERFDAEAGLAHVAAIHVNDSEAAFASRKDRHAHIGEGLCGDAWFRAVLRHPAFAEVPKVLETEKGDAPSGRAWDLVNAEQLASFCGSK